MILNTLEAPTIPGLEAEAWIGLTPEQQDLTLSVARRGLEARGLAQTDENGQFRIHRAVLTAVGVCAYPLRSALVEHWGPGAAALRLAAHTRDDDRAVHAPGNELHTFTLLSSEADLVDHLATACNWSTTAAAPRLELTVSQADFTRALDAGAAGSEVEARQALGSVGGSPEAATALAGVLANQPRISIIQLLLRDQTPANQEFTLIESGAQTWIVSAVTNDPDSPQRVRTISGAEIGPVLLRGL